MKQMLKHTGNDIIILTNMRPSSLLHTCMLYPIFLPRKGKKETIHMLTLVSYHIPLSHLCHCFIEFLCWYNTTMTWTQTTGLERL